MSRIDDFNSYWWGVRKANKDLGKSHTLLYLYLTFTHRDKTALMDVASTATEIGLSKKTVYLLMKDLEEFGLVKTLSRSRNQYEEWVITFWTDGFYEHMKNKLVTQ